jgi:hypothetical protein
VSDDVAARSNDAREFMERMRAMLAAVRSAEHDAEHEARFRDALAGTLPTAKLCAAVFGEDAAQRVARRKAELERRREADRQRRLRNSTTAAAGTAFCTRCEADVEVDAIAVAGRLNGRECRACGHRWAADMA